MTKKTYSQEEVDAIFARAIEHQSAESQKLSREEIVSAASEVGISANAIDDAERDLAQASTTKTDRDLLRTWRRRSRLAFARHFVVYVLVNALLAFINVMTTPHFLWFLLAALGWGIGIAMHFMSAAFPDEERILERERRNVEKRARRDRWKKRGASFERAVNEGVKLLLEATERQNARVAVAEPKRRIEQEELEEDDADEAKHVRRRS